MTINREGGPMWTELHLLKQKAGLLKAGHVKRKTLRGVGGAWSMWLGHLGLLTGTYSEEKQTSQSLGQESVM